MLCKYLKTNNCCTCTSFILDPLIVIKIKLEVHLKISLCGLNIYKAQATLMQQNNLNSGLVGFNDSYPNQNYCLSNVNVNAPVPQETGRVPNPANSN
ncbi:hypothetical protein ABEB36_003017 [Hypothenemus hampei]|uniref:Uncharacterized protein n=1 Tax=Hypothenemus hampei TaxID=57062 RepID=A0ABD1F844_HYPHA